MSKQTHDDLIEAAKNMTFCVGPKCENRELILAMAKELRRKDAVIERIMSIAESTEELNMGNYTHDLVDQLNSGMIDLYDYARKQRYPED